MNKTSKLIKTPRGKTASAQAREGSLRRSASPAAKVDVRKASLKPSLKKPLAGIGMGGQAKVKKAFVGKGPASSEQPAAKRTRSSKTSTVQARPSGLEHESLVMMASGVINAVSSLTVEHQDVSQPQVRMIRRRTGKPRLLWVGDAVVPTGFATVTHAVLNHLRRDWDVIVSGVNYDGAKHRLPYQVLPARQGGDMWGMNRFVHLCSEFDPAAVIINNDWWNVAQFAQIGPAGVPIIGYMPVDGGNLDPVAMTQLNKLHAAVWYTHYGHREAAKAGFSGPRHVIPHGIDTTTFHPMSRDEARRILDLNVPKKAFIVGNLNRNQPRKRLDVTIEIFADWIKRHQVSNAFLLLHCAQKDTGWDLRRTAAFHGVADRLLLTGSEDMRGLQSPRHLNLIYNSLDVQMTTTLGEGWGLTTMEGMACGIPQIVPDSSALAEWALPAVKIPCSRLLLNPQINTTGALVDHEPFVAALHELYRDKAARARLSTQGVDHVSRGEFDWRGIARQFHALLPVPSATPARRLQRA